MRKWHARESIEILEGIASRLDSWRNGPRILEFYEFVNVLCILRCKGICREDVGRVLKIVCCWKELESIELYWVNKMLGEILYLSMFLMRFLAFKNVFYVRRSRYEVNEGQPDCSLCSAGRLVVIEARTILEACKRTI